MVDNEFVESSCILIIIFVSGRVVVRRLDLQKHG
jgi:hypothetical protein